MPHRAYNGLATPLLKNLAEFRFELRRFLQFSERAALEAGLQPQQHQLLLQVAASAAGTVVTIAYAADRLGVKHNSAVELVDRSVREGLLERRPDPDDKRQVLLHLTRKGEQILISLSGEHARELEELGPRLAKSLEEISMHAHAVATTEDR